MRNDDLGTRMKTYEAITTSTNLMPNLPVYARIDGRAFHTFCRGLKKPFDLNLVGLMQLTCKELVEKTNAILGYVQSDEISLAWEDMKNAPFDGRLFKLTSVLASMATSAFTVNSMHTYLFDRVVKMKPTFDCRVCQLPNMVELANMFIWRENDATRNSISMVAQANFSHKELQGKSSSEMQEMLFQQKGINFNDYASELKRGTYYRRVLVEKTLDEAILNKIPLNKRPIDGKVIRSEVHSIDLPIMKKVENKVGVYFRNEKPIIYTEKAHE